MVGKRMLFLECPPLPHDANAEPFRKMGLDVEVHQFFCSEPDAILDEDKYRFADFDVILISISAGIEVARNIIISRELMDRLRKAVQRAEVERACPIRVIGMNLGLSGDEQRAQAEVFDGLFIGWDSTREQAMQCLGIEPASP